MIAIEHNAITGITTERELTPEEIAQMEAMQVEMEAEMNKVQVPEKVSNLQLRVALLQVGITEQKLTDLVNLLPEPQKSVAKIALEYATNIARDNEMIGFIAQQLNWTTEQTDEFFIKASQIRL